MLLIAFVAGLSLALACANVVFRDVEHLVTAALLPWFFLTPVLYSFDQLPGSFQRKWITDLMYWGNPLTPPLEALRAPLYLGQVPRPAGTSSTSASRRSSRSRSARGCSGGSTTGSQSSSSQAATIRPS